LKASLGIENEENNKTTKYQLEDTPKIRKSSFMNASQMTICAI
jgi:hypothetical protein